MKKKLLKISIILTILFLIVAVVAFFLMKSAAPEESGNDDQITQIEPEQYDVNPIIENIYFLKLNTYDDLVKYAQDYPIYIQSSDDATVFAIGELYIENSPVNLFYKLNDDGSIRRFDGSYRIELSRSSVGEVIDTVSHFEQVIMALFSLEFMDHSIYGENGSPIDGYDEESYELLLNGKAKYHLSIIDEKNTYWNVTIVVTDQKQMEIEFFRCFDLSLYDDDQPNIDLRPTEETGEDIYEE